MSDQEPETKEVRFTQEERLFLLSAFNTATVVPLNPDSVVVCQMTHAVAAKIEALTEKQPDQE